MINIMKNATIDAPAAIPSPRNEWMNEGLKAHQHTRLFSAIKFVFFVKWLFAIVEEQQKHGKEEKA